MAYDPELAERIRQALKRRRGVSERKMFGGLCFTIRGHMCCGVIGNDLVLRLGEQGVMEALKQPHTRPMDFTGKPLKSMIYLSSEAHSDQAALKAWIDRAIKHCHTLPPKL